MYVIRNFWKLWNVKLVMNNFETRTFSLLSHLYMFGPVECLCDVGTCLDLASGLIGKYGFCTCIYVSLQVSYVQYFNCCFFFTYIQPHNMYEVGKRNFLEMEIWVMVLLTAETRDLISWWSFTALEKEFFASLSN